MGSAVITAFDASHLAGVIALCDAEGWTSFPSDPPRAQRILTAPGGVTLVAVDGSAVVSFAFAIVDAGPLDAYLSTLAIAGNRRREGIARQLINELFRITGVQRMDLLAEPGSEAFYDTYPHFEFRGYRIYPESH